jgi:hypothetical protein
MESNFKKIFLSHAKLDREIANRIIDKLIVPIFNMDKQRDVFYTSRRATGIRSNTNWKDNIKENLTECKIFIPLITINFKNSEMCLSELGAAWALNKDIYPLLLPPINYDNFGVVISELQADNLMSREDIKMLIKTLAVDIKKHYDINLAENNTDSHITKFLKSMRSYRRRNPDLFNQTLYIQAKPETIQKKEIKSKSKSEKTRSSIFSEITIEEKQGIIDRSKIEWPEDYSMQEYHIKEQVEALNKVREFQAKYKDNSQINGIIERAINEWPKDYTMQVYTFKEQLDAFNRL